jgi:hypothetical protein
MIRYSQSPKNLKNAVADNYVEEKEQEKNKISDPQNPVETKATDVDDDGSDSN